MPTLPFDAVKAALDDTATMALPLTIILEASFDLDDLYGSSEQDRLDPLTVLSELEERYGLRLPEAVENRIQAILLLRTTTSFENNPEAFTGVVLALTEGYLGDLVTGMMETLLARDILWGLFEVAMIDPYVKPLSPAVLRLIEVSAADDEESEDDGVEDFQEKLEVMRRQLQDLKVEPDDVQRFFDHGMKAIEDVPF